MSDEQRSKGRHIRLRQCRKLRRESLVLQIGRDGLGILAEKIASGNDKSGAACLAQNDLRNSHEIFSCAHHAQEPSAP